MNIWPYNPKYLEETYYWTINATNQIQIILLGWNPETQIKLCPNTQYNSNPGARSSMVSLQIQTWIPKLQFLYN